MTKTKPHDSDHNEDELVLEDETNDTGCMAKIKKLQEKLKVAEAEKMENLLGWQRTKADYSNLKASSERERSDLAGFIKASVIEDFLPLVDSFDIAMSNREAWEAVPENWRRGVEYIYNQFQAILSAHGVSVIDPAGQTFNPLEHESIGAISVDTEALDHRVMEVATKGYRLGDRVIRPAQVKTGEYRK